MRTSVSLGFGVKSEQNVWSVFGFADYRSSLDRLVNRIANRDGDAVISSCASRDGQIAMILAIRLVILSLFRAESGHKACL